MFNQISDRFETIFKNIRGLGKINDSNIEEAAREVRRALLEADVNFKVAKNFGSKSNNIGNQDPRAKAAEIITTQRNT